MTSRRLDRATRAFGSNSPRGIVSEALSNASDWIAASGISPTILSRFQAATRPTLVYARVRQVARKG